MLTSLRQQDAPSSPVTLTRTVSSLDDFVPVDSSLTNRALDDLGWSSRGLSGPDIETLTAPNNGIGTVAGQSIVVLDVDRTQDLFDRIVGRRD